jgi:hypothetical protein
MTSPTHDPAFIRFIVETYKDDFNGYRSDILGMRPVDWQDRVGESVMANKRTVVSAGHGIGKTGLAASAIHWFAATRPRFAIVATANTEDQLKKKLWRELAKVNDGAKNKDWFKWDTGTFTRFGDPTTQAVALPNNENNPGAFAGTHEDHVLGVFDEAAEIPRNIWNVFNGAMTTAGSRWLAISNPRSSEGYFYDAAFGKLKARKDGETRRLWKSFVVPSFDSPLVEPEYVETMRDQLGEQSDDFRVQVLGLPPNKSVQQFLSPELITKAMERDVPLFARWPLIIGCDVGRGDRSVMLARRGRKVLKDITILHGERTTDFARRIAEEIRYHREEHGLEANVIIEELGMGVGTVETLQDMRYEANVWGVNTGESSSDKDLYLNLRCEMWAELRDWLEGDVELPNNQMLYDDLVQIKRKSNGNSALRLETKEEMRRRGVKSPDVGDALALTFAVPFELLADTSSKRDRYRDADEYAPAGAGASWASM